MSKARAYSKVTQEAAKLLGRQIKIGRKRRGWSENQLAERAGIARATVQKIERGDIDLENLIDQGDHCALSYSK